MNERIQKLAEQARQYANSMYPSGLDIPKWGPAYHERFAELIVKECIGALDQDDGATHHGELLREYFGVEE